MATSLDVQQDLNPLTIWRIDPATSRAEFTVRMVTAFVRPQVVTGRFTDVSGTIHLDDKRMSTARVEVAIGVASVDTGLAPRDGQLQTAAFFDAKQHPTLTFSSRMLEEVDRASGRYRLMGDLTMGGVTKAVRLDLNLVREGAATSQPRLVINATTVLNRRDYGLRWNSLLTRVADDVTVKLAIQATREAIGR
jgi:polyisoprenoid-binding protein YceI